MKTIAGEMFNTSFGKIIIPVEQTAKYSIGDAVLFEGQEYTVLSVIPPTKPGGNWSLQVS